MNLLPALGFGFLLGVKHALDADHIVAISAIVSQSKKLLESTLLGIFWGIGHTLTLLLIGLIVLAFRLTIPVKLALFLELLVGVVLVILGVSVIRAAFGYEIHLHPHEHHKRKHFHFHFHKVSEPKGVKGQPHQHEHRSFFIGMIHGLAGSAALMLLVLTTINSFYIGLLYIILFGIGSILGMSLFSGLLGFSFAFTIERFEKANKAVSLIAGFLSIGLGLVIVVEIGLLKRLFL